MNADGDVGFGLRWHDDDDDDDGLEEFVGNAKADDGDGERLDQVRSGKKIKVMKNNRIFFTF